MLETENMGVWTKKRGSMKAVVLMATPCPKSLHGKGLKWIGGEVKMESGACSPQTDTLWEAECPRKILQGLDSPQPMTAMTSKKSPG